MLGLRQIHIFIFLIVTLLSINNCFAATEESNNAGSYVDVTGGKLYYETYGSGTPLIVLHGGPGLNHTYLLPQMLELSKNHQVIFYDQRGTGKSIDTALTNETINMTQTIADLEALRKKLNLEKFALMGHSWGALVAMNYIIAYPDHVDALILVNSAPADIVGFKAFYEVYLEKTSPYKAKLDSIANTQAFKDYDPKTIENYYRIILESYFVNQSDLRKLTLTYTPQTAANQMQVDELFTTNYLQTNYNLLPQLENIETPTLIVHGDADLIPIWTVEKIKDTMPNAQLYVLQNTGHFVYIEQPQEFFRIVEQFLTKK